MAPVRAMRNKSVFRIFREYDAITAGVSRFIYASFPVCKAGGREITMDNFLFNIDISTSLKPENGSLLVAEPFLKDFWFKHAVIAMIDCPHDRPSMGVVMNRKTSHRLDRLIPSVSLPGGIPVYCGGPMSVDRLFFLHTLGTEIIPQAREVAPGLFVGGDFKAMTDYVAAGYPIDGQIRFFIGYSGWEAGQLDGELDNNVWAVGMLPDPPETLLTLSGDRYWHREVRRLGDRFRAWQYHPSNPSVN